jgi:hypothetical protein
MFKQSILLAGFFLIIFGSELSAQNLIINTGSNEISVDIFTIDTDGSFVYNVANSSPYNRPVHEVGSNCEQEKESSSDFLVMCGPTQVSHFDGVGVKIKCKNTSTTFCAKVLRSSIGY